MLILTRRPGESIIIDNEIQVKVFAVKNGEVRLGIKAPKEISIHREEIQERVDRERNGN